MPRLPLLVTLENVMRKIEQQMIQAIKAKKTWSHNNTAVIYDKVIDVSFVFLHGNQIGYHNHDDGLFFPNYKTLQEWPTRTTKSRLRALGVSV